MVQKSFCKQVQCICTCTARSCHMVPTYFSYNILIYIKFILNLYLDYPKFILNMRLSGFWFYYICWLVLYHPKNGRDRKTYCNVHPPCVLKLTTHLLKEQTLRWMG